jgi:transcriptional regulator with XRE-family HTH domain
MNAAGFTATRKRLGMTRIGLAGALGISRNTVTAYEKGDQPVPLLVRLALAALLFGLPPA